MKTKPLQKYRLGNGNGRTRRALDCGGTPLLSPGATCRAGSKRGRVRALQMLARFCLCLSTVCCLRASAQNYSIDWHKIAGGGGTSSNGNYSVSGTIGQHDADSLPMTGGNYSLTGGFWALISVVQTPGAPVLYISHAGSTVTVYWQDVAGWNLVQSGNLATPIASWSASGGITTTNGTNYLTLPNPSGNRFYRLKNP